MGKRAVGFVAFFWLMISSPLLAQEGEFRAEVNDIFDDLLPNVSWQIIANGDTINSGVAQRGTFSVAVPAGQSLTLRLNHRIMAEKIAEISPLEENEIREASYVMEREMDIGEFEFIEESRRDPVHIQRIDPEGFDRLVAPSGQFESILQTMPGVTSPNELSGQYQVRGGNFDENLVYINDFEVFRPFLIRSGEQEGLSIINPDMIESVEFSTGGFDATFGDRMSSALSINYKEPFEFESSVSGSLMGGSAHVGGAGLDGDLSYSIGARYRSNQYLLGTLDTEGDYRPSFMDVQSYLTYYINDEWQVSLLNYYGRNNYNFVPETRETEFGTLDEAIRLTVFFDGQEIMQYQNLMNGLTFTYEPNRNTTLDFQTSLFTSLENEDFDVIGQYWLDELETDLGDDDFGEPAVQLGTGTFHNHGRNQIRANIYNVGHQGHYEDRSNNYDLKWGAEVQGEIINDRLQEWEMEDSAGFSLPLDLDHENDLELKEEFSGEWENHSNRIKGYLQNTFEISDSFRSRLTAGIRSQYWDFNNEVTVSPRLQYTFEPNRRYNLRKRSEGVHDSLLRNDMVITLAAGMYHQPPFYREMRDFAGNVNEDIRSQESTHFVAGKDYFFSFRDRPFKWTTEIYYKHLRHLIPYQYDNMRVRYFARNNARGYAAGIDMKLYGEFIRGLPSWLSFSLMQTEETIFEDNEITSDITLPDDQRARPTDQRAMFNLFFQDFLPANPNYTINLNMIYGTGLPHGPADFPELRNQFRMQAYQRIDIGFGALLKDHNEKLFDWNFLDHFNELKLTAEVFNAFGFNNTFNYRWIQDVHGRRFAIPNYLTGRRLNLKFQASF